MSTHTEAEAAEAAVEGSEGEGEESVAEASSTPSVDRSLLCVPATGKAAFWGSPIFLYKDSKQRESRGEKDAHCTKCSKDLRYAAMLPALMHLTAPHLH